MILALLTIGLLTVGIQTHVLEDQFATSDEETLRSLSRSSRSSAHININIDQAPLYAVLRQ